MGMAGISVRVGVQGYQKLTGEGERAEEQWSGYCQTGCYCDGIL